MRTHSRRTGRLRSAAGLFRSTILEFLRLFRLAAHAPEDRDNGRAENCSRPHLLHARRQGFCDNPRAARRQRVTESCPAFAGSTSCRLSSRSGFSDKCSWQINRRPAAFAQLARRCVQLVGAAAHQRQDPLPLRAVLERMKPPDFIEASQAVEGVEIMRVARSELACFEITSAQVWVAKCLWALPREEMKPQPAPVSFRNALRFSEKRDKQEKDKIGIHLRLELEIARKIFRRDLADPPFELKRSMQRMIEFLDEHNQRPDIAIAQTRARIVLLQLLDQPARIINANVKLVSRSAEERPRQLAQFTLGFSSEH